MFEMSTQTSSTQTVIILQSFLHFASFWHNALNTQSLFYTQAGSMRSAYHPGTSLNMHHSECWDRSIKEQFRYSEASTCTIRAPQSQATNVCFRVRFNWRRGQDACHDNNPEPSSPFCKKKKKKEPLITLFCPIFPQTPLSRLHFSLITNSGPLSALPIHYSVALRHLHLPFHVSALPTCFIVGGILIMWKTFSLLLALSPSALSSAFLWI